MSLHFLREVYVFPNSLHLQAGVYRVLEHRCTIMTNLGPKNGIISKGFQEQLIEVVQSALYENQGSQGRGDGLQSNKFVWVKKFIYQQLWFYKNHPSFHNWIKHAVFHFSFTFLLPTSYYFCAITKPKIF